MVSVVETAMHVFIHTDRATRPPPLGSGFVLHTGVSSEPKFHRSSLSDPSASHSNIYAPEKNSWMRQQARKFEWALQTARAHRAPEPWLLADTDVIIQCGAEALRRRFEAAQTDLLIGAEAAWWPSADPRQNPYPYRGVPLRYPNSGLLLGTQRGFERLVVQLQQISQGAWSHTNWPGLTLAGPNTSAGPNIGGAWHWQGLALVGSGIGRVWNSPLTVWCLHRAGALRSARAWLVRGQLIADATQNIVCHPGASRAARASIRGTSRASAGSTTRRACTPRCRAVPFSSSRTTRAST